MFLKALTSMLLNSNRGFFESVSSWSTKLPGVPEPSSLPGDRSNVLCSDEGAAGLDLSKPA
jgi:hypothetical protein